MPSPLDFQLALSGYRLTRHAHERASERGFTTADVVRCISRPCRVHQSRDSDHLVLVTDFLSAVVDERRGLVVTVYATHRGQPLGPAVAVPARLRPARGGGAGDACSA